MTAFWFWVIVAIAFAVVEVMTVAFFAVFITIGALGAAVAKRPRVLALEEPTRGVDIGTKAEIYHLLRGFVNDGGGVIAFCNEAPEVFELADRAVVVSRGRLSTPLNVRSYDHMETLATDITRLEGNSPAPVPAGAHEHGGGAGPEPDRC